MLMPRLQMGKHNPVALISVQNRLRTGQQPHRTLEATELVQLPKRKAALFDQFARAQVTHTAHSTIPEPIDEAQPEYSHK